MKSSQRGGTSSFLPQPYGKGEGVMATKISTAFTAALTIGALMMTANQEAFARGSYGLHSGNGRDFGFYGGYPSAYSSYGFSRDRGNARRPTAPESGFVERYDPESCSYTVYWCD